MRVLAFRHVPFEHLGLIAGALEGRGVAYEYIDLFAAPEAPVRLEDAAGLIFMGGPMSANDDLPYLGRELALIREAVGRSLPVLGVCLGSQLIAKALGARVYRNPMKEIGWGPVYWTQAGCSDWLLKGLSQPEVLFHWHGETFDMPAGADWLGWSEACRHQAFRVGNYVYGFQFHLEVTPDMIAGWCLEDANAGDLRELEAPLDPRANAARLAELSSLVFGRWAELAAARARPG